MTYTVLLYGATGYSGRLIAEEARVDGMAAVDAPNEYRMVLAGRDASALRDMASELGMEYRVAALDDRDRLREILSEADVVINAAGPFAFTAVPMAKAALATGCHYVDINGELDVYKRLDDYSDLAVQRDVVMVCSAGHMTAASDVLLDWVLSNWRASGHRAGSRLAAVRIALSRIPSFSRGSGATVTRSFREQVAVVRAVERNGRTEMMLWHEPVGRLERTFDLGPRDANGRGSLRIASATNLVDTLTARATLQRHKLVADTIESYMESGTAYRLANQVAALAAPFTACTVMRGLARAQLGLLPDGPTDEERQREGHVVVLEVDALDSVPLERLRWETPNVYQLTSQLVIAVAKRGVVSKAYGWRTPAAILGTPGFGVQDAPDSGPFRNCRLVAAH